MLDFLDIRISFLLRKSFTNNQGENPISMRITFRGERREVFTGRYCLARDWDSDTGSVRRNSPKFAEINRLLDEISRRALSSFDHLRFANEQFTLDELVDKIKGKDEKPTLLIDYLKEGRDKMKIRAGVDITKATYDKYCLSAKYMEEFLMLEFKVRNFSINRIDVPFLEKYFMFLRTRKNLQQNTAIKYMAFVKTVLYPAIRTGVIRNDPFRELRLRPKPVNRGFLTQEQINLLADLPLTDPDLERKRDIFLFACYTGLAYIDLKSLSGRHIFPENDGSWYIIKARQKTGEQSIIPILPLAERILLKYSYSDDIRHFDWYVSSNQKMNEGLKIIGEKAGIDKPLHMHLARHTFATTVTLSNGVPIESVSKMLGHASIKQTMHYAKVVAGKIKHDMAKIRHLYK
jgi:site-specific recombinase XerD